MPEITLLNLEDGAEVYSPTLIIHGTCLSKKSNSIQIQHHKLPPLTYDINNQHFKGVVHLVSGENQLKFITNEKKGITIKINYSFQVRNPPIHLCLLVANDSPLCFDSPSSQKKKEGGNGLEQAIQKLRVAGRLMQAFTDEQMFRNGFGHRSFQFVEEDNYDTLFQDQVMRKTIKIHILHSDKTVAELRDPNLAQQNSKGNNTGGLFSIAMDALKKYGGPFDNNVEPVQAAVIFMDSHWDVKLNLITAHAALGGGDDKIKLAIFGSHGLYSWPTCLENVPKYFTDSTKISSNEVANDCNECGTHWECLNVTLGAFMHEIGHLLGCPHQESGVMLRDYVRLNKSFLTKEGYSSKTNSYGSEPPIYPYYECFWHRLDILRFIYHPSFSIPQDYQDPSFMRPGKLGNYDVAKPSMYPLGNESVLLKSDTGIFLIEIICGELAKSHIEYLPLSLGGPGPQRNVQLSLNQLRKLIPPEQISQYGNVFSIKVHSVNSSDIEFKNFPSLVNAPLISMSKYGYLPQTHGIKSILLGNPDNGIDVGIIPIDMRKVKAVRIYHGGALDGIRFYTNDSSSPDLPPRNYLNNITETFKSLVINTDYDSSILFGKVTNNFTDFILKQGEFITGFNLRTGCWIDAIQVVTSHNRTSEMFGNKNGGTPATLTSPNGQPLLGLYGRVGQWVDAIGVIYCAL